MDKNKCLSILELQNEDASQEEIKKAYKQLALKHHPDRQDQNASDEDKKNAETKFKEIAEAYDLLMNPEKLQNINNENHGFPHGFPHGFIDPNELFNHIFRNMNMENHFHNQGLSQISSSVCFINGQRVERVTENINGVTRQTTFISGNQPNHGINIRFN